MKKIILIVVFILVSIYIGLVLTDRVDIIQRHDYVNNLINSEQFLPEGDYERLNEVVEVNDKLNLAMIGLYDEKNIYYFDILILDDQMSNGPMNEGYDYSYVGLTGNEAKKVLEDNYNIVEWIIKENEYPLEDEGGITGVIPYSDYEKLFKRFDFNGRKVEGSYGKSYGD